MKSFDYSTYSKTKLEQIFNVSSTQGLSNEEVRRRQNIYGKHRIAVRKYIWLTILLRQVQSPFVYLLIIASVISFALHNTIDALVISAIITINIIIGFIQEYRAEQALTLLREQFTIDVLVTRENKQYIIDSTELVPGDIITLKTGDYVPADLRILETQNLQIDESMLTGETKGLYKQSAPLKEPARSVYEADNSAFWGTHVISGKATGIVINTGTQTVFGDISLLALNTSRLSSFQIRIAQLSRALIYIVLITVICIFVLHALIKPGAIDIIQLLLFSLAIAVSIIPEALPLVTTFAMTEGALALARKNVLVKRLSAIEDLGSITVLCTDKTGTLTENNMLVENIYAYTNKDPILYALLASDPQEIDPLDKAIKAAYIKNNRLPEYTLIKEIPFDPKRKTNTVLVSYKNENLLIVRGAYEEVAQKSVPIEAHNNSINGESWIAQRGLEGRRTLAVAIKKLQIIVSDITQEEHDMDLIGIIAFEDPIKPHTKEAVEKAHKLGISVVMLTGDSKEVAYAIASRLDIARDPAQVITGFDFVNLPATEQIARVEHYTVYARVTPDIKYQIINLLEEKQRVGFLGDGINDAPALNAAHVGIVVKEASALAKDAADILILKKNISVIIDGIIQGRRTFANTFKYLRISLSSTMGNFYSMAIASLFINFLPLLPLQILLTNILSDLPMIAISTDTVSREDLKTPSSYTVRDLALTAFFFGMISSFFDFITFAIFYSSAAQTLQTNWFLESLVTELVFIFSLRTRLPFYKKPWPSAKLSLFVLCSVILTIALPFTPMGQELFRFVRPNNQDLRIIIVIISAYFIATELIKPIFFRFFNARK